MSFAKKPRFQDYRVHRWPLAALFKTLTLSCARAKQPAQSRWWFQPIL